MMATKLLTCRASLIVCTHLLTSFVTEGANDDWHFYGKNIALNKNATQEPNDYYDGPGHSFNYPAHLAVDGNTDRNFNHRSCSHTIGKSTSAETSWTVELGKPFKLTGIIIYNRNGEYIVYDGEKIRLKNFLVYADGQKMIYNSSGTVDYNKDKVYIELNGLMSFSSITIRLPKQQGYSDGGNYYLTLCEVQIYAAPRPACNASQAKVTNGQVQIYNDSGRLFNEQYTAGTIIEVNCKEKLSANRNPPRFKCLATGKYNHTLKCVEPFCELPNIANGKFIDVRKTKFEVGTKLHFTCDTGFTAAASTIECQENFEWGNWQMCQQNVPGPHSMLIWAAIATVLLVLLLVVFGGCICYQRKRRKQRSTMDQPYLYSDIVGKRDACVGNDEVIEFLTVDHDEIIDEVSGKKPNDEVSGKKKAKDEVSGKKAETRNACSQTDFEDHIHRSQINKRTQSLYI